MKVVVFSQVRTDRPQKQYVESRTRKKHVLARCSLLLEWYSCRIRDDEVHLFLIVDDGVCSSESESRDTTIHTLDHESNRLGNADDQNGNVTLNVRSWNPFLDIPYTWNRIHIILIDNKFTRRVRSLLWRKCRKKKTKSFGKRLRGTLFLGRFQNVSHWHNHFRCFLPFGHS